MRIAVFVHDDSANAHYRAFAPAQALQARGHQVAVGWIRGPHEVPVLAALQGFDVVYFWRLFYPPIWRLARALAGAGIGVVWDNDDDMTSLPRISPAYRQYGGSAARRTLIDIKTMMGAAHVVTTPSESLAARLEELRDGPVTVVENYLPGVLRRPWRPAPTVSIGWTASAEHRQDWDRMPVKEAIVRLMAERPRVEVKSIGVRLGFRDDRYQHAIGAPLPELLDKVAFFDVGIAPLLDIAFNRSRSNIKLKEYAAAGVPWVASDVGPYRGMGEREGGIVVGDDGWYEALNALLGDDKRRRRLAENAAKWAQTQTVAGNVGSWEAVLQQAVELAAQPSVKQAR